MKALPIQLDESITAWETAIYAFLAEKERRFGSMRTVDAYIRTLQRFFGTLGKTPEQVTPPDVFGFEHGLRRPLSGSRAYLRKGQEGALKSIPVG